MERRDSRAHEVGKVRRPFELEFKINVAGAEDLQLQVRDVWRFGEEVEQQYGWGNIVI